MDRNSAIGLTLIAVLLLLYFNFFAPEPPKETPATITTEQVDSVAQTLPATVTDTARNQGPLATVPGGEEKLTRIETQDLIVTFSSHGGIIKELELKKFKTYYKNPLLLVNPASTTFKLNTTFEGKDLDLYSIFYETESRNGAGDTAIVTFTAKFAEGKSITQTYQIPSIGYVMNYSIGSTGLAESINGDQLTLEWVDHIANQEKDIAPVRANSTVTWYTTENNFDKITESSTDAETEVITESLKWVGIKQMFFSNAIIAKGSFKGGELSTSVNQANPLIAKSAKVRLFIPKSDIIGNVARYELFFGPNQYELLTSVTKGFGDNLALGWPPVSWVSKFVIIPIFHFLETFIGNYGLIILIMVIIIKLILTPLSYSSYLGMAKMRLLKPELDLIKEKNGDNMTQAQQDQMKLYQQAGVNPFAGCIPLLLQMPILFAMFYFFPVSVELRQQPFLWADDLSTYDSIAHLPFVIPFYGDHVSLFVLLMTASTLVYTWQNNQISSVTGPMKSMSYIMPVIFLFILNSFSAGLSFYYFVSNLVTFAQQAIIKRFVDEDKIKSVMEDHKKKMASGTATKSKFMTKLDEAMKASEEARKKAKR